MSVQSSSPSLDSIAELKEIEDIKAILKQLQSSGQHFEQFHSPISSQEPELCKKESSKDDKASQFENVAFIAHNDMQSIPISCKLIDEAKAKLQKAKNLLSEMQQTQHQQILGASQNSSYSCSNPNKCSTKTTREVKQSSSHDVENHKTSKVSHGNEILSESHSGQLATMLELLTKIYQRTKDRKPWRKIEERMDQLFDTLHERERRNQTQTTFDMSRNYQTLKEQHELVVEQLNETYESFRHLQEEYYQLQETLKNYQDDAKHAEERIQCLEERLLQLNSFALEMHSQRDEYAGKLKQNQEDFLQIFECFQQLSEMIDILSSKWLAQVTFHQRKEMSMELSNTSFMGSDDQTDKVHYYLDEYPVCALNAPTMNDMKNQMALLQDEKYVPDSFCNTLKSFYESTNRAEDSFHQNVSVLNEELPSKCVSSKELYLKPADLQATVKLPQLPQLTAQRKHSSPLIDIDCEDTDDQLD